MQGLPMLTPFRHGTENFYFTLVSAQKLAI